MPLAQEAAQAPGNASNVIKIVLETLRRLEREHAGSSRFEPINNEAAGNDHSIEANGDALRLERKSLSVGRWDRGMRRPTNTPEMKPVAGPNPVRASRQNGPRRPALERQRDHTNLSAGPKARAGRPVMSSSGKSLSCSPIVYANGRRSLPTNCTVHPWSLMVAPACPGFDNVMATGLSEGMT